jgi:hypothetical protein
MASALIDHFSQLLSDKYLMSNFAAMLLAEPIDPDHEVFCLPDGEGLNAHVHAFGRAKIAIDRVDLPEKQRLIAWSKLARCLVFNTHCATLRFGAVTERFTLLEGPEAGDQENPAEKVTTVSQGGKRTTIGQTEKSLIEIEETLLRKTLGYEPEASMTAVEEEAHEAAADAARELLAIEMAKHAGVNTEVMREMYKKSRELRELQTIMRWAFANNSADGEADKVIEELLDDYRQGKRSWKDVSTAWRNAILTGIPKTDEKYEILLKKVEAGLPHLEETVKKQEESKGPVTPAVPTSRPRWFSFLRKKIARSTQKTKQE